MPAEGGIGWSCTVSEQPIKIKTGWHQKRQPTHSFPCIYFIGKGVFVILLHVIDGVHTSGGAVYRIKHRVFVFLESNAPVSKITQRLVPAKPETACNF